MQARDGDLGLLIEAARAAGQIAARHWKQAPEVRDKPGGAGPVTAADLEVDAMLRARLLGARPDHGWLSEESPDSPARLSREAVFIVDPIDGTRAFIAHSPDFAHSLALARGGQVVAAVVYLPMRERLFAAALGQGAHLNGAPLAASTRDAEAQARVLVTKPNLEPALWPGGVPPVARHFRSSLAYRLALVGQGRFDAMLTLRDSWEWDIAAGALIVAEAGGSITDRHGAGLRFNNPVPRLAGVVAGAPGLHRAMLSRLAPAA